MAKGLGADATILDVDVERLRFLDIAIENLHTLYSNEANLDDLMPDCDLLIGRRAFAGSKSAEADHTRNVANDETRQRDGRYFD